MSHAEIFKIENGSSMFEQYGQSNGMRYWFARDLMKMLGYEHFDGFEKTCINKAIGACTTLKIPVLENFQQFERDVDGKVARDYKLSRFACYLIAMNGDVKKPTVAKAQAYFASMAEAVRQFIEKAENVERILIRDDVSEREGSLSSTAFKAGVENYPFFQNAGYRGMYNMDLWKLREFKGVQSSSCLLDFMGREELAANLFRITQTEAKIRNERVSGQRALEGAALEVGKKVRATMIATGGSRPENLPIAQDIKLVRKGLKSAERHFAKLDKPKAKSAKLISDNA